MLTIQAFVYIKKQRVQPELCHTNPETLERDRYNAKPVYVVQFNCTAGKCVPMQTVNGQNKISSTEQNVPPYSQTQECY